ncbi:DNA starvation/stationary phase protection protein [Streptomyces sp. RY43-2]|uniref:DNA starvation/stationary phase protection protein n=1 Tax=Streptomyces macrolidinus TaxID=2952607 RepID=A0ABT0ZIW5_9ACTN|nr:DNA starvation/stationary phase protection protein [Streptomyces macrolidinus]MCN9243515.1 DNA starvation/stationary phase protection protein [Streptomyces macrolidinus]
MPASPGGSRRSENGAAAFAASPQLTRALQQIVVDLVELHLQGKQAHWNVIGHNFRDLHLQLDQIVDDARESADVIAERMRALGACPDGRSDTVTANTTLPAFPEGELSVSTVVDLVTARLRATVDTVRTHHDQVDGEDPATADLLHTIIDSLEKHAWMVSAENRSH